MCVCVGGGGGGGGGDEHQTEHNLKTFSDLIKSCPNVYNLTKHCI